MKLKPLLILRIAEQDFVFADGRATIGRAPENRLVLPHESVAPTHATVETNGHHGVILSISAAPPAAENEAKASGLCPVWVNGFRIDEETSEIDGGDLIQLGDYVFEVRIWQQARLPGEKVFLDRIAMDLRDDRSRGVFANWLEGEKREAEAAWVRGQLAIDDAPLAKYPDAYEVPVDARRIIARTPIESCGWRGPECPKRWDKLTRTDYPTVRKCEACKRNVFYAHRLFDAQKQIRSGRVIAYDAERFPGDLQHDDVAAPETVREVSMPSLAPTPPSLLLPPPSSSEAETERNPNLRKADTGAVPTVQTIVRADPGQADSIRGIDSETQLVGPDSSTRG